MDDSKKAIQNIKQALRQLATNGVPVGNMIEAMKEIEEKYAESEDERVRKVLYKMAKVPRTEIYEVEGITKEQALAYLEKQGEPKPALAKVGEDGSMDKSWHPEKQGEQKHAWSEEDEKMRTKCAACLGYYYHDIMITTKEYKEAHNWLNSLKDRVLQQPKQEWSEEDEEKINSICNIIADKRNIQKTGYKSYYNGLISWLKSLRPQNHWKPSDEQIGVIEAVINNRSFQRRHLDSLYEQLKKLRKE